VLRVGDGSFRELPYPRSAVRRARRDPSRWSALLAFFREYWPDAAALLLLFWAVIGFVSQ
jgi:hypothetical protein